MELYSATYIKNEKMKLFKVALDEYSIRIIQ